MDSTTKKHIFTAAMLEGYKKYIGKPFILQREWKDIEINFPWVWSGEPCESCGHVKNKRQDHIITKIEVYVPMVILEEDKAPAPEIWLGYTLDRRVMKIPDNKRSEYAKLANERNQ